MAGNDARTPWVPTREPRQREERDGLTYSTPVCSKGHLVPDDQATVSPTPVAIFFSLLPFSFPSSAFRLQAVSLKTKHLLRVPSASPVI